MCDALRELMKDDLVQAERNVVFQNIKCVMKSLSINAEQAMDILEIPADDREIYRLEL